MGKVGFEAVFSQARLCADGENTAITRLHRAVLGCVVPDQKLRHSPLSKIVQHQHEKTPEAMRYHGRGMWPLVPGSHPGTQHQL